MSIVLYQLAWGKRALFKSPHSTPMTSVYSTYSNIFAAGHHCGNVTIWNQNESGAQDSFQRWGRPVEAISISSDESLLLAMNHNSPLSLWDCKKRKLLDLTEVFAFAPNEEWIAGVFHSLKQIVALSTRNKIFICTHKSNGTFELIDTIECKNVVSLALSSNKHLLATTHTDNSVEVWSPNDGTWQRQFHLSCYGEFDERFPRRRRYYFNGDESLLYCSWSRRAIAEICLKTGRLLREIPTGFELRSFDMAFDSSTRQAFVVGDNRAIRSGDISVMQIDLDSGTVLSRYRMGPTYTIAFHPIHKFAVIGDFEGRFWKLSNK